MEKVTLYQHTTDRLSITMELYFDQDNRLVFEGQDVGKAIAEMWSDSDWEYEYTIEPPEVNKLYAIFNIQPGARMELLEAIRSKFHTGLAYWKFGAFLNKHDIIYRKFTWI